MEELDMDHTIGDYSRDRALLLIEENYQDYPTIPIALSCTQIGSLMVLADLIKTLIERVDALIAKP